MDEQTVDNEFAALQQQAQHTASMLQALGGKLQAAVNAGDQNAREWQLDLRELALAVQEEQNQTATLLQAIHQLVDNHLQQTQPQYEPAQYQQPMPYQAAPQYVQPPQYQPAQYAQQPQYQQAPAQGGMLQRFLGGGFGRAIVTGAGFGIGDDIVNDIFGR